MLAQEVENLQNNGVFRLKLLGSIERQTASTKELNKTISDIAEVLFEKLDANAIQEVVEEEETPEVKVTDVEDEDDFKLPPLNLKKK